MITIMRSLSTRVLPRSLTSFPKTGPSLRKKGFHYSEDSFRKTISNKGWSPLCQPPRLAATMVVQEFHANLETNVLKKVRVCRVLVDFSAKSINEFYNLEPDNYDAHDRL